MQGRGQSATRRGEAMGITLANGGVPREVIGAFCESHREAKLALRARGMKGENRMMDARIRGDRGKGATRESWATALEYARQGMDEAQILALFLRPLTQTVRIAVQKVAQERAGPKAS